MFKPSEITKHLHQSAIRAASSRCAQQNGYNLGQGLSELPIHPLVKEAAANAINADHNQYSACEGYFRLRQRIAEKITFYNGINVDPATQVVVTAGATGAYVVTMATLLNPDDEVIVFEPSYGYHSAIVKLFKGKVKGVKINLDDFSFDIDELKACISEKTKAIVVCTPANPSGKVFSKEELIAIGELAKENNCYVVTDEIYEYILYPGFEHVSLASIDGFQDNTITISGLSKTYSMTGWRLGYVSGPAEIMEKIALTNDLYYVCPPTPLQHAAIAALNLPETYYDEMRAVYRTNCDIVVNGLQEVGFKCYIPQGAYYLMVNVADTRFNDSEEVFHEFLDKANVAIVPGKAFYLNPEDGKRVFRVCFGLLEDRLKQAIKNIQSMT